MTKLSALIALGLFLATPCLSTEPVQWGCPKGQVKYASKKNANFDDLSRIPGAILTPIQRPSYRGIFYQGFNLVQVLGLGLGGVVPQPGIAAHSGKNYAGSALGGGLTGGTQMMTVNYANNNGKVKEFTPESFYFGCALNAANDAADPPQPCAVIFTGYKGKDNTVAASKMVCAQTFQYNPTTITGPQQMAFSGKIKEECKSITHGTFSFTPTNGLPTGSLIGLAIDDVKYSIAGCKRK